MSRHRHLVATVITLSLGPSAYAQEENGQQEEQAEEGDQKKEKKKKDKKDKKKKDDKPPDLLPEIAGYVQLQYRHDVDGDGDGATDAGELRVRRARIKVRGKIIPKVRYNIEVNPGSDDTAGLLRDAYLDLRHLPKQDVIIGQQKTQFGYENLESSNKLYVINRSEMAEELGHGVSTRDIGVGVVGDVPLPGGFSIEDGVTVVNGAGQNARETTRRKNIFGRVGGRLERDDLGLDARLGVSGGWGDRFDDGDPLDPLDDATFVFRALGVDLRVDHTWAFVAAEVVTQTDRDLATDAELDRTGWYVLGAGKTPWKTGPIVRYDQLEDYERWTFGGYWGESDAPVRVMGQFELRKDRDHRFLLWTSGRF